MSENYSNQTYNLKDPTLFGLPDQPYVIQSFQEVRVRNTASLNIQAGVVVKFVNQYSNFRIDGNITAIGTSTDSIVFTSIFDDTFGGDTNNDGAQSGPQLGDAGYLIATDGSLDYCLFRYGMGWKMEC